MFKNLDQLLNTQNIYRLYGICTGLVVLVALLDYLTGFEISVFIFYAVPIWLATWYIGEKSGLLFALLSVLCWYIADNLTGYEYAHDFIPHWNAMIRLVFFVFTALALDAMKAKLKLEELNADYDSLTNILNGRGFRERSAVLFPLLKREKAPFALAFIDVDNFKHVNDSKGHAEGDRILKNVSEIMRNNLRESDMPGRLGGDEFVIFLPRTNPEQAETVISKLKARLDEAATENSWPIGYSVGVGSFDSTQTALDDAIRAADKLMYEVKKGGKGRIVYKDLRKTA